MAKKDLVNESNNLTIIVVLSLFLICSLGYIAYDKYFSHLGDSNGDSQTIRTEIKYNVDGIYIKSLMNKIVYHSGINNEEFQLYAKNKVTLEDLSQNYKNALVFHNISGASYSIDNVLNSSQEIFGKGIYETYPEKITILCDSYHLRQDGVYEQDPQSGTCGGTSYQYYEKIEKVRADKDHIYIYQRVGFQCDGGICKNVEKKDNTFKATKVIKKLETPTEEVNIDEIKSKLNLYKFTFTYDARNNLYYFESVEKNK